MSDDQQDFSANEGGDQSFISFMFGIVSIAVTAAFLPVFLGSIRDIFKFIYNQTVARGSDSGATYFRGLCSLCNDLQQVPLKALWGITHPDLVFAGFGILKNHTRLWSEVSGPASFRYAVRPRIVILVFWLVLASMAAYVKLTFDAHAVLGVKEDATEREIKKAYRAIIKVNHPDHNSTDVAKVIFAQSKKAYMALIKEDEYKAEARSSGEMVIGVALPWFLTTKENPGLVLLGLLCFLFSIPYLLYKRFSGSAMSNLQDSIRQVNSTEQLLEKLYLSLGIPEDPKFVQRQSEKREMVMILKNAGLGLPVQDKNDLSVVDDFPSPSVFKSWCAQPSIHGDSLKKLGFDQKTAAILKAYFEKHDVAPRANAAALKEATDKLKFTKTGTATYKASIFFIKQAHAKLATLVQDVKSNLALITAAKDVELRSEKKLMAFNEEILETITRVYKEGDSSKISTQDFGALVSAPSRGLESSEEVSKEVAKIFRMIQRRMQEEQMMRQQQQGGHHH